MNLLKTINNRFEEFLCVFGFIFFVLISNLQVIVRYLFASTLSIPWSEELIRYSFIWMIYLGFSWALKEDAHLRVDILKIFLSQKARKVQEILISSAIIIFSGFIGYHGLQIFLKQAAIGQTLPASGLPMSAVYFCFPFACFLVILRSFQRIYHVAKQEA